MDGRAAARHALELARQRGLAAEAFYSASTELEIRSFQGQVEHFERADAGGLGLRVVDGGRSGSAYTEFLDPAAVAETLEAAAAAAKCLARQEGVALADWPAARALPGLEAPEIAGCPVEKKIEMVLAAEGAARSASPEIVNVPWAGYGESAAEVYLANTEGLERSVRQGSAQIFVQALAARGEEKKSHYDFCFARRLAELAPERLGRSAALTAVSLLGARQPKSGKAGVLFAPRAFATLLAMFSSAFSGRNAEEKRTPLAGRLGARIGAPGVGITDDATLPDGPASRPFDAEGVPSRRLAVVEDGVLRAFLHTTDTARRAGVEPTGHALRSYKGLPSVAPSNLFVPAGRASAGELRAGADLEIIEVTGGAGANPVSGEFSLPMAGFVVAGGRRGEPAHNFTVAGNLFELLGSIRAVGADFEFGLPGMGTAFGSGSVLVAGLSVGGAG